MGQLERSMAQRKRLPSYLRRRLAHPQVLHWMKKTLRKRGLHTVCESARCPNIGECFSLPTATFMILGNVCTRRCGFCSVDKQAGPLHVEPDEPAKVALTAKELGLEHVVVTSPTRDDLPLGGAEQFASTITALKEAIPGVSVEVLTPDFLGDPASLRVVLDAAPDVFNHNVETVPRLYPEVRPQADYLRSLDVLLRAKENGAFTKSGLMVGLGEGEKEVREVLADLLCVGCDVVTIGQYLQPTRDNIGVKEYISPDLFKEYEEYGRRIGIPNVYSGPFVRSSYNAGALFRR